MILTRQVSAGKELIELGEGSPAGGVGGGVGGAQEAQAAGRESRLLKLRLGGPLRLQEEGMIPPLEIHEAGHAGSGALFNRDAVGRVGCARVLMGKALEGTLQKPECALEEHQDQLPGRSSLGRDLPV